MSTTYYLTNTNSDLSGGDDFNFKILPDTAATATNTISVAASATETSYGFTEANVPSDAGVTGNYSVKLDITTGSNAMQISIAVARINSSGTVQQESSYTAEQTGSAGVKTFTLTSINLGTWNSGDRLRVNYRFRNTGTHTAATNVIRFNGADTEVVAPWTIAEAFQVYAKVSGTWYPAEVYVKTSGVWYLADTSAKVSGIWYS